jgi:hypothetical protein
VERGKAVVIVNVDRYLNWLELEYEMRGQRRLNPHLRKAIEQYVGGEHLAARVKNPKTQGESFGGYLPGTHAEILALNDILEAGAKSVDLATLKATTGAHFDACVHCGEIIDALPKDIKVEVWTGRAVAKR